MNVTGEDTAPMLRTALGRNIGMNVGSRRARKSPFGYIDTTTVEGSLEKR